MSELDAKREAGEVKIFGMREGILTLQSMIQSNLDNRRSTIVVFLGNYGTGKSFMAKMYADVIHQGIGIVPPDEALIIPEEGNDWGNFWMRLEKKKRVPSDAKKLSLFTTVNLPFFWPKSFLKDPSFIYVGFQANQSTRISNLVVRKEMDLRNSVGANYTFSGKDYINFIIDASKENRISREEVQEILRRNVQN